MVYPPYALKMKNMLISNKTLLQYITCEFSVRTGFVQHLWQCKYLIPYQLRSGYRMLRSIHALSERATLGSRNCYEVGNLYLFKYNYSTSCQNKVTTTSFSTLLFNFFREDFKSYCFTKSMLTSLLIQDA